MTMHLRTVICFLSILFAGTFLAAVQTAGQPAVDSLLQRADSLRTAYLFEESVMEYMKAAEECTDSLRRIEIEDMKMLSENGSGMLDFVSTPTVVARHMFSLEDFYLFYPLPDRSWRVLPNVLDSTLSHPVVKAVFVPEGSKTVFFSAPDSEGSRNLYRTEYRDTIWSLPALLNEQMTSSGDEIYPMLSPDGKSLYFASSGLYGMGGYDLYVSTWNEEQQEWGTPANMGFPFSSPADDFLFVNTADDRYSIFASNRNCPSDSVYVYVLEYDNVPVRKSMRGAEEELRKLALLEPVEDLSRMDNAAAVSRNVPESVDTRRYMDKVAEVRTLRDSIYAYGEALDRQRAVYAESDDADERAALTADILRKEAALPVLQDSLDRASKELQKIEMEFLFNGLVIDPDKVMHEADRKVEGASSAYVFARMSTGDSLQMEIQKPEVKFDYTFMILPEGRFAEDNTLPDGIVYQIQLFSLSNPANVPQLKGLSPVFEEKTATGKYIYRVGVFRKYNDVLSNLNKVKRLGFRTAFITAFNNGSSIQVQKARVLEKQVKTVPVYQINIVTGDGSLPEITMRAIKQICSKDIAKTEKDGKIIFVVGTFDDVEEMEKVMVAVKATGVMDVSSVKVGTKEIKL